MLEDEKKMLLFLLTCVCTKHKKEKSEESKKMLCEATQCEQD